jgi:branched-chain amino acid transport system permease protein
MTTGIANFAHGQIAVVGGYIAFALGVTWGLPWVLASVGGVLAAMLVSVTMERAILLPLYGKSVITCILATFGFAVVLESLTLLVWGSVPKSVPALASQRAWDVGVNITPADLIVLVVAVAIAAACVVAIARTRVGRAMRGCAQDAEVSSLLGVPAKRMYMSSFALAGITAGVAGVLQAPTTGLTPTLGLALIAPAFAAAILGGLGSLQGAMVGGVLIGVLENLAAVYVTGRYATAVAYVAIVVVLLIRPSGLFGDKLEATRYV